MELENAATVTATGVTVQYGHPSGEMGAAQEVGFARRHIITKGATGAMTVLAGAGGGATATATVAGSDTAFTVTLTTGTAPAAGDQCVVGAGINWGIAPKLAVTPKNAAAATAMGTSGVWVRNTNANTWLVSVSALPASTVFIFDVVAIQ